MPKATLAEFLAQGRDNNFTLIRLLAAIFVIIGHSFLFCTQHNLQFHGFSISGTGVDIFFIISGFLVSKSWINSHSPYDYIRSRFLRIWPALCISSFIISIFFAFLTVASSADYLKTAIDFIYATLVLNMPSLHVLAGVFIDKITTVINGSLWTLNYEVLMYAVLGILGLWGFISRSKRAWILLVTYISLYGVTSHFSNKATPEIYNNLLRFSSLFFIGIYFHLLSNFIRLNVLGVFLAVLMFFAGSFLFEAWWGWHMLICDIAVAYLVFWFAYLPAGWIRKFNLLGDYSYGVYIYGWPVTKLISQYFSDPILTIFLTVLIALVFAIFSWHFIEKPALDYNASRRKILHADNTRQIGKQGKIVATLVFLCTLIMVTVPIYNAPAWRAHIFYQ